MVQTFDRRFSHNEVYFLQILLSWFKVCGSAPFTIHASLSKRKSKKPWTVKLGYSTMGSIYNVVLLFFLIITMIWIIINIESYIDFHDSKIKSLFTIGIIINGIINLILIISIYSIHQKKLLKYFNVLLYLDKSVLKMFGNDYQLELKKRLIKKFFAYFLDNLILMGISFYTKCYIDILLHIVTFIIGNIISQYVIILIFISEIYRNLNSALLSLMKSKEQVRNYHTFLIDTTNNDEILNKIILIRKIQRDLSEVLCNFADFFSLSLLFCLYFFCGSSIFHSYNIGLVVFNKESWSNLNAPIPLIMFKEMYLIFLLTSSVANLLSEMKRTSVIVYKLVGKFFTQLTVKLQLEQFSLELLHRKSLRFTACGLFSLDNTLLTSVARVISTHMILLMECQFYLGQSQIVNHNSI